MKLLISEVELASLRPSETAPLECKWCKDTFYQPKTEISSVLYNGRKDKTLDFCCRSCASKYNIRNSPKAPVAQSKPERYVGEILERDFPFLRIEKNTRKILPSGLELDIYIPGIEVAIEVNGIHHYQPIHGQEKLDRTQTNDRIKIAECRDEDISFFVINVYDVIPRNLNEYIRRIYRRRIKPVIKDKLSRFM